MSDFGTEKELALEDLSFTYYVKGDVNKPAIFMLHAAFADHNLFSPQFDDFYKDYFCVTMDLIGHGNNYKSTSKFTMKEMTTILSRIMLELGIDKAHFIGISMGSLLAQGMAHSYPKLVKSVTVVGGYSIHKENKEILQTQSKEMFKWFFYILFNVNKFKKYIIKGSSQSDSSREVFDKALSKFKRGMLKSMQGLNNIFVAKEENIKYPLLIICGEKDLGLVKEFGKRWEVFEEKAQYVEMEEAGHCANMDNPNVFNRIYRKFIKEID
jgi:3-oxoadipate enol-lactonase